MKPLFLTVATLILSASFAHAGGNIELSGPYEQGLVLGKAISINLEDGVLIHRPLIDIKVGEFADDPSYVGSNYSMSIPKERTDLIEKFKVARASGKNYIFKYVRYYPLNLYRTFAYSDSHFVTDIVEAKQPTDSSKLDSLGESVKSEIGRHGWNSGLSHRGRITSVERWGLLHHTCGVEVNFSGIAAGESTNSHDINFAVYDEAACKFVEKLIYYQRTVEVSSSQDLVEFYDSYTDVAHEFQVLPLPDTSAGAPSAANIQELREQVEKALLNDPEFISKVRAAALKSQP